MSNQSHEGEVSKEPLSSNCTCKKLNISAHATCGHTIVSPGQKKREDCRNNNSSARWAFLQSFLLLPSWLPLYNCTKQHGLILSGKLFVLTGVALFCSLRCHVCNYIDGLLTSKTVAHKWFRDVRHACEIRYRNCRYLAALRQCEISWAIGFFFTLFFSQLEQLNRRRYGEDHLKTKPIS